MASDSSVRSSITTSAPSAPARDEHRFQVGRQLALPRQKLRNPPQERPAEEVAAVSSCKPDDGSSAGAIRLPLDDTDTDRRQHMRSSIARRVLRQRRQLVEQLRFLVRGNCAVSSAANSESVSSIAHLHGAELLPHLAVLHDVPSLARACRPPIAGNRIPCFGKGVGSASLGSTLAASDASSNANLNEPSLNGVELLFRARPLSPLAPGVDRIRAVPRSSAGGEFAAISTTITPCCNHLRTQLGCRSERIGQALCHWRTLDYPDALS